MAAILSIKRHDYQAVYIPNDSVLCENMGERQISIIVELNRNVFIL